jgi:hypothetical protein
MYCDVSSESRDIGGRIYDRFPTTNQAIAKQENTVSRQRQVTHLYNNRGTLSLHNGFARNVSVTTKTFEFFVSLN